MAQDDVVINLDAEFEAWGGERHQVVTTHGPISVLVCGDQAKPALVTYPDVGLNYLACFEGLFSCPEAYSVLFHNFCIYHIDPPGHEDGAAEIPNNQPLLTVDDLADQVAEVLDHFKVHEMIGLGVGAGSYILNLFAIKYRERAIGLILVSPICRKPTWSEWIYNKAMINILYYCGATSFVKDSLLQRYFSPEVRASSMGAEVLMNYRKHLDDHPSRNMMRYMQAIHQRGDITESLAKLKCRTLVIVGENSPFHCEAVHMTNVMSRRYQVLIEVTLLNDRTSFQIICFLLNHLLNRLVGFPESCCQTGDSYNPLGRLICRACSLNILSFVCTGSTLWVAGDRGATTIHAGANRVVSDVLQFLQAAVVALLTDESPQPAMRSSGVTLI
ncbi:hypothetical protein KC19_12G120600 [Ceratodon purpureus]|uniref:Uncharacterized protein n=1 Tax=Ceratodon purpureus TaxID=3225 RepID=A0A8T0G6E1_CERPU|nr:hypothetical protein KC19_12G120600 [Ceratodon purpureus]